jgi:AsmA protein
VTEGGAITIEGDYAMAGRRGTLAAMLASLKRLSADGSPASFSVTDSAFTFSFDGRLAIAKSLNLAGQASLEWKKEISISGPFETRGKSIVFKEARFDSPAGSGTGAFTADFAGQIPKLHADLVLDGLDLAAFLPRLAFDGGWSERPLGFGRLKQVDAKGTFNVNALRLGPFHLGRGTIGLTAVDGRLQVSAPEILLHGGKASAGFTIDGSRKAPELALTVQVENLTLPEGRGAIPAASISLTSEGLSQAELAGRLSGSASFAVAGAQWGLPSLEDMLKRAGEGILSDWHPSDSEAARFDQMSATFTIADGIAKTSDLRIAAGGLTVAGAGEIDALRQAVDLKADTSRPDGKPAFPVSLILQGSWLAPRLYPDMPGILDDPASAYRALSKLHLASETKP